ncbi:MAG: CCA tRNA nucleotidyltransferase [Actinomycetota bacterium]|nr:CCA tRNA nucleotidyltransferase [Actinomycetota bacterium]
MFLDTEVQNQVKALRHRLVKLQEVFMQGGNSLYLVGGSVRDLILGVPITSEQRLKDGVEDDPDAIDFDFTTDALPSVTKKLLSPIAESIWDVGAAYGTVAAQIRGLTIEITTHRGDVYREDSRKPVVTMPTSLEEDLVRRDFRMNSMAIDFLSDEPILVDPFGGIEDIENRLIATPRDPSQSFEDDPLRMLRAVRFAAKLDFRLDEKVELAIRSMIDRLDIVSTERIRGELDKLMMTKRPSIGLRLMTDTGLASKVLPELPALALEQDPIHHHKDVLEHTYSVVDKTQADLPLRLAALFHDIGKPRTRKFEKGGVTFYNHDIVGSKMTKKRMRELKYSSEMVNAVSRLVYLHLRFHTYQAGWTDKAVRRYVSDAGELLDRLNALTLADCTTRNANKVRALETRMVELKDRIVDLRQREELDSLRPEIDGVKVMEILEIGPGRTVGEALSFLMDIRLDEGLLGEEEIVGRLKVWWQERSSA